MAGASPDSDLPVPHYSKLLLLTVSIGIIIKTIMSGCIFIYVFLSLAPIFRNKSKNKRAILETSPSWCHKWPWYLAESCPTHSQVLALLSEIAWFLSSSKRGIYRATFPVGSQKFNICTESSELGAKYTDFWGCGKSSSNNSWCKQAVLLSQI